MDNKLVEDSDWMALVNLEAQRSTGQLFLTFKRLKIRGKKDPMAIDYFNHPFTNEKNICLATDVDLDYSLSVRSLATDLESVDQEQLARDSNAQKRSSLKMISGQNKATELVAMMTK